MTYDVTDEEFAKLPYWVRMRFIDDALRKGMLQAPEPKSTPFLEMLRDKGRKRK